VNLGTLLNPSDRVLDLGAAGPEVAEDLAARGITRYLGLTDDSIDVVREAAGPLAGRFHSLGMMSAPSKISADMVILRSAVDPLVWSLIVRPAAGLIAVEHRGRLGAAPEALLVTGLARAARRVRRLGRYTCGGSTFDVYQLAWNRRANPRHYLSPVTGVSGFAERLADAGVRHAVLRWFDELPEMERGEDLDLLVADEDVETVQEILAEEPGLIPVDLYSESGLSGSAFRNAAYFPPALSRGLLDRSVPHSSGFRVPAPLDHLHSMAYHAVYHKGESSGLGGVSTSTPEHDYQRVLRNIAERVGAPTPSSLAEMDQYLASVGWRPPEDTLRRLSVANDWVARTFFDAGAAATSDLPELGVFLIRERTLDHASLEELASVLDHFGFEVVLCERLSAAGAELCADQARGGNWGRGPFPTSGGPPAAIVVTLHYRPAPPDPGTRKSHPHLTNLTVLKAKDRMRDLVLGKVPPEEQFNAVHSSDNEVDAWQYLEMGLPDRVDAVSSLVTQRRQMYRERTSTGEILNLGRRSVVSRHGDRVRKTFYPAFSRYADRETRAFTALSAQIPEVPEILDHGEGWFEIRYFENMLADLGRGRLLPLDVLRQMVRVLTDIHDAGYELVDARPDNFVLDPVEGLKILDFEFIRPLSPPGRRSLRESASFVGLGDDAPAGDVPVGRTDYVANWLPRAGMSLDLLLRGTTTTQQVSRTVHVARQSVLRPARVARRAARGQVRQLKPWLRRAGRGAGWWADRRADAILP